MEKTKLTFEKIIKLLKMEDANHTKENGEIKPTKRFRDFEDLLCQKCSPEQIYKIAKLGLVSTDIKKLGKVIIASKDLELNYKFACYVEGADVLAHGRMVIASKDPKLNYWFARDSKGADVEAHGEIVLKSQDLKLNYKFAEYVKGADVLAHGRMVIASKDPEWNYMFARYVVGADILAHAQILYEEDQYYFERLIKELKEKEISFEYDENGKPVKVFFVLDQIIENFDNIEIE